MKEKIYTIPINEAIDSDSECPFCLIEKKLERESIEYTLGAAMMEPDYRTLCNEKGFCKTHASMLFNEPNKLSLALILDSQLEVFRKKYDAEENKLSRKKGLFKKPDAQPVFSNLGKHSCVVCDKINSTVNRYGEVFFYMWKNDDDFRKKVLASKGFCMPHLYFLSEMCEKHLSDPESFIKPMYEKQKKELLRIQEEIHLFTLKFDYRNKDLPWGNAKDAPLRTLEKNVGYLYKDEDK